MKPLFVANWKCNPVTLAEAKQLFDSVKRGIKDIKNVDVVICPPFLYILNLKSEILNLKLGGQDCFWAERGAYTGEVSSSMLKDLGCQYVILGHSERRRYFNETDEMINKKIKKALITKLKPIFCIGETKEEREKDQTQEVLELQIKKGLERISKKEIRNLLIAYEPVWAIGTGKPCDFDEAQKMSLVIRKIVAQLFIRKTSENLPILYGGSVDSKNARDYIKTAGMSGLLVGGASLNAKEFIQIIKNISKA